MDPYRWQKIKPILENALEIGVGERDSYLREACGSDAQLRSEVDAFLAYDQSDRGDLEDSPVEAFRSDNGSLKAGDQIGRYRVIEDLGVGGMGSVYLAERVDGEFDQRVAIKVIKRGMDSESIIRRFLTERRILASLQHPNIAHLLDGGTTVEGLPYFVMEYVRGETITEYARRNNLGLASRLDLFREVCSAVSYAHQNLVIHRDLKPSNILIDRAGIPKLLDFGIAKLLRLDGDETATQHFVFTPEYASPEQIRGENLTTTSDVYSLGVILYELLTGIRPFQFDDKNLGQIIVAATQTEPPRPSSKPLKGSSENESVDRGSRSEEARFDPPPYPLSHLSGNLDNIVLKALKKDAARRYASVEQLSEDIRRHLRGLPVSARPDTLRYRSETFARRNPFLVGSLFAAFLFLILGITAATIFARQAEKERQKAERRFNDVRVIANSLIFEVNEKIDESPIKARELLVTRSVEYLDKLASEAEGDLGLQSELAAAYEKIGDVQAFHYGSGVGDTGGALINHQKALAIRERQMREAEQNPQHALDLASSYLKIADLSATAGMTGAALENYRKGVDTLESALAGDPNNLKIRSDLAKSYAKRGQGILRSGSISDALENYTRALEIAREVANSDPANADLQHGVSVYESYAAYAMFEMGRKEEALDHFSESLRIDTSIWEFEKENREKARNLSSAELWVGVALRGLGRFDESRVHLQRALDIQRNLQQADQSNVGDLNSLADVYLEMGVTLSDGGAPAEAVKDLEKALTLYESVAAIDRTNLSAFGQIAFTRRHLADAVKRTGNARLAIEIYSVALREVTHLIEKDSQNSEFQYNKAICSSRLGEYGEDSLANLSEASQTLRTLLDRSPDRQQWKTDLDHALKLLAQKK